MTPFKGTQRVTSPYGYRTLNGVREHHNGIDVAISTGTWDIREVTGGTVIETSTAYNYGRGWLIKVQTAPGVVEIYQHLSKIYVKKGDKVSQGKIIGVAGATGYSFGIHLHFEVQVNGYAVNPSEWLGLPNVTGTYNGNDNLDNPVPTPTPPSPTPTPEPVYPDSKYRVYRSVQAFSDKGIAIKNFEDLKSGAKSEYILCAVGDGKWRIAQVYLATTNLDNAINNMADDCIICGSDMTKHRIYKIISANENLQSALNNFKQRALSTPNEVVLTTMGGDNKYRVGEVFAAYESLTTAADQTQIDQILC